MTEKAYEKIKVILDRSDNMCEFCENIAKNDEEFGEIRMNESKKDFIFVDKNAFHVFVDTGDSFCPGILNGINFCPICGRDLRSEENE